MDIRAARCGGSDAVWAGSDARLLNAINKTEAFPMVL